MYRLSFAVALLLFACTVSPLVTDAPQQPEETRAVEVADEIVSDVQPPDQTAPREVVEQVDQAETWGEEVHLGCLPGEGCFGDKCSANPECQSGWCVDHLGEGVCTSFCQEECPQGWHCVQVAGTDPDLVYVCVSNFTSLCRPCKDGNDCKSATGNEDVCVDYGLEGSFCGGACVSDGECPWGFHCADATTVDDIEVTQCVAEAGVCPCTSKSVALAHWTPCGVENQWGTCHGKRVCGESGLTDCDALVPAMETCNGIDDDCDGEIDEPVLDEGDYVNVCNDDNPCTEDNCMGESGCQYVSQDGGECMDGDACTIGDHCQTGVCLGTPIDCDDGNPCTDDACDGLGGCLYESNYVPCDDDDPCTLGDQCADEICTGTTVPCDCQEDGDCAALDDGDLCNGTLMCELAQVPYKCVIDPMTVVECPQPEGNSAICKQSHCDSATGQCSFVPANEGHPCDEGDFCTIGDKCQQGECAPGVSANCNDGNPCTDDSCDSGTGCHNDPNTQPCQDGDACTVSDGCAGGQCVPGPAPDCDDGNVCTDDSCDPALGCKHVSAGPLPCDDGNACTTGETCVDAKCVGSVPVDCLDGNPCTDDSCDPAQGCTYGLNSLPCDDGDVCTAGEKCENGACAGGIGVNCNDGNPCTDDSCDAALGCAHHPNQAPCFDLDLCTIGDHCAEGLCVPGEQQAACEDDNPCTTDSCEPDSGCLHSPVDGACDDGNACTIGETCTDGKCVGSVPVECVDENVCTDDSCDPALGCIHTLNNAPCDDDDACTMGEKCDTGACQGGASVNCNDGNACTDDSCDVQAGCQHFANILPCEDGSVCTLGDTCGNKECLSGQSVVCDDGNLCTDDHCDPVVGCTFTPNTIACEDGNACTTGDICSAGQCVGVGILSCNDNNICTDDSCDTGTGCIHTDNAVGCDDDDECTTGDICSSGMCGGTGQLDCNDSDVCTDDSCDAQAGCQHVDNISPCNDNDGCTVDDVCTDGVCAGTTCEAVGMYCVNGSCSDTLCGGISYGGYCWYEGSVNSSCSSICSGHGGCLIAGLSAYAGPAGCAVCQQFHVGAGCFQHGDCDCAAVYPGWHNQIGNCGYNSPNCTTCGTAKACGSYTVQRYCPCAH